MGIVYANPSLLEIVVDVRWALSPLSVPPGAAVDPFFEVTRSDLEKKLASLGYTHIEQLAPAEVPKEFLAWKPLVRFSQTENQWPKLHFGPGLFSVHMNGSEYKGWEYFKKDIHAALDALLTAFPSPEKLFKTKSTQLRYINAFKKNHSYENNWQFTTNLLNLSPTLPHSFIEKHIEDSAKLSTASNSRFGVSSPQNSIAGINVSDAKIGNEFACLMQLSVESIEESPPAQQEIHSWFESAHTTAEELFSSLLSEELKSIMKPEER